MYHCKKWFVPIWANFILLLLCCVLSPQYAKASHAMGADITYEYVSPGRYRVTLTVYRDCNGIALTTSPCISYSCGSGTASSLNLTRVGTPEDITPLCETAISRCDRTNGTYGVQEHVFTGIINVGTLCNDNITIRYNLNARNSAIRTINNPGSTNLYVEATILNPNANANNSPIFTNVPSAFVCVNTTNYYNQGAIDPDGDSLAYALVPCKAGSTSACAPPSVNNVSYRPGFSATAPLTGTVNFDAETGALTYRPTVAGQVAVLCTQVTEYRNGAIVGTTLRDMQITVIDCDNELPEASGFDPVDNTTGNGTGNSNTLTREITACYNTQLCFNIYSKDPDPGTVFMQWNRAIPGATFVNIPIPASALASDPTIRGAARFCWTPTPANVGAHVFTVYVEDNACPLSGNNQFTYRINITENQQPPVVATGADTICIGGSAQLNATSTAAPGVILGYSWSPAIGLSNANIANPVATPTTTTTYTVTARYAGGCTSTDEVKVVVYDPPRLAVTPNNPKGCPGSTISLGASTNVPNAIITWYDPSMIVLSSVTGLSSSLPITLPNTPGTIQTYSVSVVHPITRCSTFQQVDIQVGMPPVEPECINIYASPTGSASASGTFLDPTTIQEALNRAACNNAVIKLAIGNYEINTELNISSFLTIEGGFDPADLWTKTSQVGATTIHRRNTTVSGVSGQEYIGVFIANGATNFRLQDLTLRTDNATAAQSGLTNYGLILQGCSNYTISRVVFNIGNAGNGVNGVTGADGAPGAPGVSATSPTNGGRGGDGGYDPLVSGAIQGGAGGSNYGIAGVAGVGITPGSNNNAGGAGGGGGAGASGTTIAFGAGGASGAGGAGSPTASADPSVNGAATFGASGAPTSPPLPAASGADGVLGAPHDFALFYVIPGVGTSGENGTGGAGGAGGAGGRSTNASSTGGAGGGGGGGGQGGYGGTGGSSGGGVFGIYTHNNGANAIIQDCNFTIGTPGTGGVGGAGGQGGAGGVGGAGSAGTGTTGTVGGNGGYGKTGGVGGVGGNGQTGLATKIYQMGTPFVAVDTLLSLASQPIITVENVNCTNADIIFEGTSITAWDFDIINNNATPATGTGSTSTVQYTQVQRYSIGATSGGTVHNYRGFHNIAFSKAYKPDIITNANVLAPDTFQLCVGDFASFESSRSADTAVWNFNGAIPNPGTTVMSVPLTQFNNPGFYEITLTLITDCCGDSPTDTIYLYVDPIPTPVGSGNAQICEGGQTTLTLSGISPTDSVVWSPATNLLRVSDTEVIVNPLESRTYTATVYTVIDTLGSIRISCPRNVDFNVTVNPNPEVVLTSTDIICQDDGTMTATVTNANGATFSYLWSTGATTSTIVNLAVDRYYVTVTNNATNCVSYADKTVLPAVSKPQIVISGVVLSTCTGDNNASLSTLSTGGATPYTYAWSNGGTTANISGLAPGTYSVTLTDANGCIDSTSQQILETPLVELYLIDSINPICETTNDGFIQVEGTGGSGIANYNWSDDNTVTGPIRTGLLPGNYTVTVTDVNGCALSRDITLVPQHIVTTNIEVTTPISCFGGTATITVNATGGDTSYTYAWTGGSSNVFPTNLDVVSGAIAGNYNVAVTDSNGCVATTAISVSQPDLLTISTLNIINVLCFADATGSATIEVQGGTNPYTYAWPNSQTTATATGLAAGTYIVTVTDFNACIAEHTINIAQPANPVTAIASVTSNHNNSQLSCNGASDGSASVIATGGVDPYTYIWSNGSSLSTATGLNAGTHRVTVTDANACTVTTSVEIIAPVALVATIEAANTVNVLCKDSLTGSARVTYTGGTGTVSYLWSNSQTTATATGLTVGTYTVTVTDANNCTATATVAISQPSTSVAVITAITSNYNGEDISCPTSTDGIALATATGGVAPYTYVWSTGELSAQATNLTATTYTVTATDVNACTVSSTVTLEAPLVLTSTIDTLTLVNVLCKGDATGQMTVTTAGGTGAVTYLWSNSQTTATATGLVEGTYTVTVTDANACTITSTGIITEPATNVAAVASITSDYNNSQLSCNGASDGSASVIASGGVGPYTYMWSNASTLSTATGLNVGTHLVTVTDANACTVTTSVDIIAPTALVATIEAANTVNVLCRDGLTGSARVTYIGGTGTVSYLWSNSQTTATATGLAAGIYTVIVTDANNCTATATVTITQPSTSVAVTTAVTSNYNGQNISCFNGNDGIATATGNGGTGVISYLWSNSQTTAISTGLTVGTYTVTVTDANNCTASSTIELTQPTVITPVIISSVDVSCYGQSTGSAEVTATGGTGLYTYTWSNSQIGANASMLAAGTYVVTITDVNNCTATQTFVINQPMNAVSITANVSSNHNGAQLSCVTSNDGQATAVPAGGVAPYTYLWSASAANQTTATATGLAAGTHSVQITDANDCIVSTTVTLVAPQVLAVAVNPASQINVSCKGDATGQVSVGYTGGTGTVTYLWSNGQTTATATGLAVGIYTVTVTDANNCTATTTATITEPITNVSITASVTSNYFGAHVTCSNAADGYALAIGTGGTGTITYMWSNNQTTAQTTGLAAGTYTVTATDDNNCIATTVVEVVEPSPIVSIIDPATVINVLCFGQNTGSAIVTTTGGTAPLGYTYLWSNGQTTATATGLTAGIYTVNVTDINNCSVNANVTITQPNSALVANVNATTNYSGYNASCFGANNAEASIVAIGGTAPYTYLWSNGATSSIVTGLTAGTYTATVTDANNCNTIQTITITQPSELQIIVDALENVSCFNQSTGQAEVSVTGGILPYTYNWSTGATSSNIAGLAAGIYTVTVTDANGCTKDLSLTITQPSTGLQVVANITSNYNGFNVSCFGANDGTSQASTSGGTGTVRYLWDLNSQSTAIATGMAAGTYCVTATDDNFCSATTCVTLTEPTQVIGTINMAVDVLCKDGNNGTASVVATGGVGPYTYLWDDANAQTTTTVTGLTAGIYAVAITDINGCTQATSVTISEPALAVTVSATPSILYNGEHISCTDAADGQALALGAGGIAPYSYLWHDGQTTALATGLRAGAHCVTVTDANGCTSNICVTLVEPTQIVATIANVVDVLCRNTNTGEATVTAIGGTGNYSYSWANGQTTETAIDLAVGSYNVTVIDANGCSSVAVATITEPASLVDVQILVTSNYNGEQITCVGATDGVAIATGSNGTAPYTYLWSANAQSTATATGLAADVIYFVTITDANGCIDTASVVLVKPSQINSTITNIINVDCFGNATGSAIVEATLGTGAYAYSWSNGQVTAQATGLIAGLYTVTVTDANNCIHTNNVTITEPANILASNVVVIATPLCTSSNEGAATVTATGGTAPYTYQWSPSAVGQQTATATGLVAGTHIVTVTDANLCTSIATINIVAPNTITASIASVTNAACLGTNTGSATAQAVGGTAPYSYQWINGQTTPTAINLAIGSYSVTITDVNGCSSVAVAVIGEPAGVLAANILVTSNYNGAQVSCFGAVDGSAEASAVNGTAPYSYQWNVAGATTALINNLSANNTYTVTVTDANNCQAIASVVLTQPSNVVATIANQVNVACFGDATGSITASVTGGTGAYAYSWSNGQMTAQATGLTAGIYQVTITDANACASTVVTTITQPATVILATAQVLTAPSCANANNAIAEASATGGIAPYTYQWAASALGQQTAVATGLAEGTHTVTVTDANLCSSIATINVVSPAVLTATIASVIDASCLGSSTGIATVTAVGGTAPYSYMWVNGETTATINNLIAGSYAVTVTDTNGCSSTTVAVIAQPASAFVANAIVTSNYNGAQVSCIGAADGEATVTALNGTAPYTYQWSVNGGTNAVMTGLSANNTYTVTATDANNCQAISTVVLTEPTQLLLTVGNLTNVLCHGAATGSISVNITGGTGAYAYTWSNGQTTAQATALVAGAYTVTVSDANNCQVVRTINITEPANSIVAHTNMIVAPTCANSTDATAEVVATGGVAPYTYSWSNGQNTQIATGLSAGSYSVTVTDINACQTVATVNVIAPVVVAATITNTTPAICRNTNTGTATVTATGGIAPYAILWSNGQTTTTAIDLAAGTYTVTVTDANGCLSIASAVVTQPANDLLATALVTSNYNNAQLTCFGASDATATVTATGGAGNYTYLWSVNAQTTNTITGLSAGAYNVTVTDLTGCQVATTLTVVEPNPIVVTTSVTPASCTGTATGTSTATVVGGTAPYTYVWSQGNQTTATATGLAIGIHTVTVTDINGCQVIETVNITEPAVLVQVRLSVLSNYNGAQVSCHSAADGTVLAEGFGGTAPYTYQWSANAYAAQTAQVSGLTAGSYTVTTTDASGCQIVGTVVVTQPDQILPVVVSTVDVDCRGTATGLATVNGQGGIAPYSYLWDNGQTTATATGLIAGAHNVTVTDANGCSQTIIATIAQPNTLVDATILVTSNYNGQQVSCFGAADGSIEAIVTGGNAPYTYAWSIGGTNAILANLVAGNYCVTVTDATGCTDIACITLVEPSQVNLALQSTINVDCRGNATGEATVIATGGLGVYTYAWDNGATTAHVTGLAVGTYQVTTTDLNGCQASIPVEITEPTDALTSSAIVTSNYNAQQISCFAGNDGVAEVTAIGGTAPYTYQWSTSANSQVNAIATGLVVGIHSVTITDNNGCSSISSVTLTEPTQVQSTIVSSSNVVCNGTATGEATVNVIGGVAPYTYLWVDGQTTAQAVSLVAGIYTVTVTDANGCFNVASVVITQPTSTVGATVAVISNYNGAQVSCTNAADGIAEATGIGGLAPYTYVWSNGQTTQNATGLQSGINYVVTITDNSGCSAIATVTLTQPSIIAVTVASTTSTSCNGGTDASAQVTATGGVGNYTYLWPNGQTTATATGLTAGNHVVTVTDANACTGTAIVNITQPTTLLTLQTAVTSNYGGQNISCNGASDGAATVQITGGNAPYSIVWSASAQTTATATGLAVGTHTVTVTDVNGCTQVSSIVLNEPSLFTAAIATQFNVDCPGNSTGLVTIQANGGTSGYTYNINAPVPANNGTFSNLAAGSYEVTVQDLNFCTVVIPFVITEPANGLAISTLVNSNYNGMDVSCLGSCDGEATVSIVGGTTPYTILWSNNSQTTATATGLCAGTHTVIVTDANGCSQQNIVTLTAPTPMASTVVNTTDVICAGDATGTATINVVGGTAPYVFTTGTGISNTTGSFTGLVDGTYVVTIEDANGCTTSTNFNILAPNALVISAINVTSNYNGSQISCNGANDGAATVVAAGGTGTYQFLWDNGQTTFTATGLTANHMVTVTDANGCSVTANVVLTEPSALTAVLNAQTNINCSGSSTGNLVVDAIGGTAPYMFDMGNGPQASGTFTNLVAANYCITVTDANNCSNVLCVDLTQNTNIVATTTVTSNHNGQQLSCATSADATATVTVTGGTAPYTYVWSNGQTGATANGLSAGVASVTITDALGCSVVSTVTVTAPNTVTLAITNQTDVLCYGLPTGGFSVAATGGTAPYQYSINGGLTFTNTVNYTNLPAATYTVIAQDANGCQATSTVTVIQPAQLQGLISNQVAVSCNGTDDGQVTITGVGGTAPYVYEFQGNGVFTQTNTFTDLLAGTYTVRVRDAVGCTVAVPVTITQPSTLLLTATGSSNPTCVNTCDGSIQVDATGGTAAYQYSIDGVNFQSTNAFSALCAGGYTIYVRDAQGCVSSIQVALVQPTAVLVNATVTSNFNSYNVSCNGAADGTATAVVSGGTGAYAIQWLPSGETTLSVTGLVANTPYVIQVTDANGCIGLDTIVLTEPTQLAGTITAQRNVNCENEANGEVRVSANASTGVGPYQYNIGMGNQTSGLFTGLVAGTYQVTITDANNCTAIIPVAITAPNAITVTSILATSNYNGVNVSCNGAVNGSATVSVTGGSGAYTYLWSAAGQTTATATGLAAGAHTVTITDAHGCSVTTSVTLTQPTLLTATIAADSAGCNGGTDGTVTMTVTGGTAPYMYNINGGTAQVDNIFTGLVAGTYTVVATDVNGCVISQIITVQQRSVITVTASVTSNHSGSQISCNGASDASAVATAAGGAGNFTYVWSNGSTGATVTGLAAGIYTVTVSDDLGCTATTEVTVTEPAQIVLGLASSTNVSCGGYNTGSASVTVISGGVGSFSYNIGNGNQPTGNFSNLAAGTYVVTVTDANGCSNTIDIVITEPTTLEVTLASTDVTCYGLSDGTAIATVTGGTPYSNGSYMYTWNVAGVVTSSIGNLPAGVYRVTVSDASGCTATTQTTVTELPSVSITAVATTDVACNGVNDGEITITAQGGTGNYEYSIDGGTTFTTTNTFTGLGTGEYAIVIRDASRISCEAVQTIEIRGNNGLEATVTSSAIACAGDENGSATVVATGGAGSYTYIWSNGQTTATATGLASNAEEGVLVGTAYAVTVTDANGCSVSVESILVENTTAIDVTIELINNVSCFAGNDGMAVAVATGGSGVYTYAWSNGSTTDTLANVEAFNYTVLVTDANGCVDSATVAITEPLLPLVVFLSGDTTNCYGSMDGVINIDTISGGTPLANGGYEFSFSQEGPFGSAAILTQGLAAGNYEVFVRDANGCMVTVSDIVISQPIDIVVTAYSDTTVRLGESATIHATLNLSTADLSNASWSYVNEFGDTVVVCTGGNCFSAFTPSSADLYQTRTFIADLGNGCNDTSSVTITVDLRQSVFIPNAFTPNGDGNNDVITVFGSSDVQVVNEFMIFDRWGELVHVAKDFLPNDMSAGWNGTYKNKPMNPGVFVYYTKVTLVNGEEVIRKGDITLLR